MPVMIKNILIGIFVLIAAAIIIFILLFLHPSVGDNAKTLRVRFTNVDKINVGTRVTYAGHPVGEVVGLYELPDSRTDRIAHNGEIYVYELVLEVDSGVNVYNTDQISGRTSGLLGEKNVEITPLPLKRGEKLILVNDNIIYANPQGCLEDMFKQLNEVTKKAGTALDDVHDVMMLVKENEIISKVGETVKHILEISRSLNQPNQWSDIMQNITHLSQRAHKSWDNLDETLFNFHKFSQSVNRSWGTFDDSLVNVHELCEKANQCWGTVDAMIQHLFRASLNVECFTYSANQMINHMQSGKGSIGRLIMRDDLYLRLKSLMFKGETVLNDMKQYGILFQLDKKWQRLQAKRMKLLDKLSNPQLFNQYFFGEVDQISTSLSSVSMVLNEAECYPNSLLNDPQYAKRFADLLRRVTEMEDSLKLYNEQMIIQDPCFQGYEK